MDEFQCLTVTQDDANTVRAILDEMGAIVFPLSGDSIGCMIILICNSFVKLGVMPFGGKPDERVYVGVYGIGCNHFAPEETHASYFAEKLKLGDYDARTLAMFWSMIWSRPVDMGQ